MSEVDQAAALEEQGAKELNGHQHNQEVGDSGHRTRHHGPASVQSPDPLPSLIPAEGQVLNDPEQIADDASGCYRHQYQERVHKQHCHKIYQGSLSKQDAREVNSHASWCFISLCDYCYHALIEVCVRLVE